MLLKFIFRNFRAKEVIKKREKVSFEFPIFGTKDFQPDGSFEQSCQIQHSVNEIKNIISQKTVKLVNSLSQAIWHQDLNLAEVTHQTGSYWSYMGHKIGQKLYIYPEEALYLLETGSIQITFNGVPLSVQRAYFVLFGVQNCLTVEKYHVYSLLNNYGYKVLRHSPQNSVTKYEKKLEVHKLGIKLKSINTIGTTGKGEEQSLDKEFESHKKLKIDETETLLVANKIDDDSSDFLMRTQAIHSFSSENKKTNLNFDYDIYLESSDKHSFKKSCLQLPNFRIVIHRGEDLIPDLSELCNISNEYKDEIPVVHAIVFFDSIAFYKIEHVTLPDNHD